jgi:hypothetical protein
MKLFNLFQARLRALLKRDAGIQDIDEEMRLHDIPMARSDHRKADLTRPNIEDSPESF